MIRVLSCGATVTPPCYPAMLARRAGPCLFEPQRTQRSQSLQFSFVVLVSLVVRPPPVSLSPCLGFPGQPVAPGLGRHLFAVLELQAMQDLAHVIFDRVLAQVERSPNLFV